MPDDLTELVSRPDEILAAEYKCQLDLSNNVSKAKFAKHVAALANFGGGHLVFGFNNDLTTAVQTEFHSIDRDVCGEWSKAHSYCRAIAWNVPHLRKA
jgi:hypothetical protein